MKGMGKPTFILLSDTPAEPELMYRLADLVTDDLDKMLEELTKVAHEMRVKAAIGPF